MSCFLITCSSYHSWDAEQWQSWESQDPWTLTRPLCSSPSWSRWAAGGRWYHGEKRHIGCHSSDALSPIRDVWLIEMVILCHLHKVAISLYSRVKIHHESNWKLWQSWPIGEHLWELLLNMFHLGFLNISPLLLHNDVEEISKSCGSSQCLVFIHQGWWWLTLVKKLILVLQYFLVINSFVRINKLPFHWVCDKVQLHIR